ncbi:ferritin-like domain-containing protein [Hyphococcus sp.]|uniref:ferritin-like domain-containing protein n=1 Tax=Hyphococcus sp. TaxID=2038636 RepID=UPI002080A27B|nr:MAG: exported protein [Marinicaulis sp.]
MHSQQILSKEKVSRRGFMGRGTTATLSVAGLSVLSGGALAMASRKGAKEDPMADAGLINTALSLEHEGIAAYQIAAESGLLDNAVLQVGILFQSHHNGHRDELIKSVRELGGTPVEARSIGEYATALGADKLKSQADILQLAIGLELGAANAYLGVIPSLNDQEYGHLFARLAADEAMHWTALKGAVGEALPQNALYFG